MTFTLVRAAAVAAVLGGFALPAKALPLADAALVGDAPAVTLAAGGCGPGFHPNRWGACRPNWGPRPAYGPRRFYGPRCIIRPTPWGPRRVCR
ncbi:GCG_CRPN prefix-to-repeats domain-containing protein [Methylobacterium sp. ID0610]|uniref:GCG_CRPN prefix-to-repeats domain-containing protein n=1 Tax=Methylobacterium carpenticola TaxID=3344827 RepID=UPI003674D25B